MNSSVEREVPLGGRRLVQGLSSFKPARLPTRARLTGQMAVTLVLLMISSCGNPSATTDGVPSLDEERIALGGTLYDQYCASCHGADLAGAEDWKIPNDDLTLKPPPHDSSGHTWHHSDRVLLEAIRDGFDDPRSRMPAFGKRLDDSEILAVVEYLKSHWGEEELRYQAQVTAQDRVAGGLDR